MLKIKVGLFRSLDMLKFKNMKEEREKLLEELKPEEIIGTFKINDQAKALHPDFQELIVDRVEEHENCDAKSYILVSKNNKVAYFRAGQSLSLKLRIGNSFVTRSYSISSSPKEAAEGKYRITVKKKENGFVSDYILNNFTVDTKVMASAPYGNMYYEPLRDNKNVVAIAGGSGITPFISMAKAINEGIEDFNLTIIYGSNTYNSILFRKELDKIQQDCNKVKVIHVLSNEEKEGYEHGFITSEIISKYAQAPYSIFVSGPSLMHKHIEQELSKLGIENRNIRYETLTADENITKEFNFPKEVVGKAFKVKVIQGPNTYTIDANSTESLLVALERAGIKAPSKCRGGECGWCRSKLLLGNLYYSKRNDSRRYSDKEFNYIHPCCTFPIDDCTIEISSEY